MTTSDEPIWVGSATFDHDMQADLWSPINSDIAGYERARILLIVEDRPLRWLTVPVAEISQRWLVEQLDQSRSEPPAPVVRRSLTAAVCTRERPASLRRCLASFVLQTADLDEILVVDNSPTSDATKEVVDDFEGILPIRRVVEPRPGLSRARNAALAATRAGIVAFIDDDVVVGAGWARGVLRGFGRGPGIGVVTGLVPPAELETPMQLMFDQQLRWGADLRPEVYRLAERDRYGFLFPYSAGYMGTGANMAVDRNLVVSLGCFDEALGAGTDTRGGEDLEMFVRVLRAGAAVVYEPSSVAWHVHRAELQALRGQMFGYGSGFSAYLTALMRQPQRVDLVTQLGTGARRMFAARAEDARQGIPADLIRRQALGLLYGPYAYLSTTVRQRREARRAAS